MHIVEGEFDVDDADRIAADVRERREFHSCERLLWCSCVRVTVFGFQWTGNIETETRNTRTRILS